LKKEKEYEMLIVGAGPVGLALALALRNSGREVVLVDTRDSNAAAADARILALAYGSKTILEGLGVWNEVPATPIGTVHVSQCGGFGRTMIRAADERLPALGYVVSAGALAGALHRAVTNAGIPILAHTEVTAIAGVGDHARVTLLHQGRRENCKAKLAICAQGGLPPGEAGIIEREYGQQALIAFAETVEPHRGQAFERFTAQGPIALMPFDDRYALVHVTSSAQAESLQAAEEDIYLRELQRQFGTRVLFRSVSKRLRYPLRLRYRAVAAGRRVVYLGNAAQTLHPVAGQGFNLALRDVSALAQRLLHSDGDPGTPALLADYVRSRQLDRQATIHFTDGLVRVFSNDFAPLRHLRGAALFAFDQLPPLRGFLTRRLMFGARAWP